MSLLGYSQPKVVRYVIVLSKKASSPSQIVNQLMDFGVSSTTQVSLFAEEIFAGVERNESGRNLYEQREKEDAMLARKQKAYRTLESDEEVKDDTDTRSAKLRKNSYLCADTDDVVVIKGSRDRIVRRRNLCDEGDSSGSEEERLLDQREREKLEQRIKERDAARTMKLTVRKLTKKGEEEIIRRSKAMIFLESGRKNLMT